jgi:hypothetical protein
MRVSFQARVRFQFRVPIDELLAGPFVEFLDQLIGATAGAEFPRYPSADGALVCHASDKDEEKSRA